MLVRCIKNKILPGGGACLVLVGCEKNKIGPGGGACSVLVRCEKNKIGPGGGACLVLVRCFHDQHYSKKNDDPTNPWWRFCPIEKQY